MTRLPTRSYRLAIVDGLGNVMRPLAARVLASEWSRHPVGPALRPDHTADPVRGERQVPDVQPRGDTKESPLPELRGDRNKCHKRQDRHAVPPVAEELREFRCYDLLFLEADDMGESRQDQQDPGEVH